MSVFHQCCVSIHQCCVSISSVLCWYSLVLCRYSSMMCRVSINVVSVSISVVSVINRRGSLLCIPAYQHPVLAPSAADMAGIPGASIYNCQVCLPVARKESREEGERTGSHAGRRSPCDFSVYSKATSDSQVCSKTPEDFQVRGETPEDSLVFDKIPEDSQFCTEIL